jgi:hypothetical protein
MPRLLISPSAGCSNKGNRFGIINQSTLVATGAPVTAGIYEAAAPSLPPIVSDAVKVPDSDDRCDRNQDLVALTRANSDGNNGNDKGDKGKSNGGNSNGHGKNFDNGHRWDDWPGDQDAFGNSLFYSSYKSVTTDGSGRITLDPANVLKASMNALANAATRIRADSAQSGLDVVTYVIGLGNATGAPELELLRRVANSHDSPTFDSQRPEGKVLYATDKAQLSAAFAAVASEMLRLAM